MSSEPRSLSRRRATGVLARPPWRNQGLEERWTALVRDPLAQLEELADLHHQGLLSREEFEREKLRVLLRG